MRETTSVGETTSVCEYKERRRVWLQVRETAQRKSEREPSRERGNERRPLSVHSFYLSLFSLTHLLLLSLLRSLTHARFLTHARSLTHYRLLWQSPTHLLSLRHSLIISLSTSPFSHSHSLTLSLSLSLRQSEGCGVRWGRAGVA